MDRYQSNPIHLDTRRWEPITGIASAGMGMTFEMLKAGRDVVYKPYEIYKKGVPSDASSSSTLSGPDSNVFLSPTILGIRSDSLSLNESRSMNDLTVPSSLARKEKSMFRTMASASGRASGKLLGKTLSGAMIDVPLAAAEGFRVLPGLYGDNVHEQGVIKDWKSGAITGIKSFAIGIGESFIDPLYQPYKGARDGGIPGFGGGLLKGSFGSLAKMAHGKIHTNFLRRCAFGQFSDLIQHR